jgi:arginase
MTPKLEHILFQGAAADRNLHGLAGARLVSEALAVRTEVRPRVIGQAPDEAAEGWPNALALAEADLRELARALDEALAAGVPTLVAQARCAASIASQRIGPDVGRSPSRLPRNE